MELHIALPAHQKYAFDPTLFSLDTQKIFPNNQALQLFVQRVNARRQAATPPEPPIHAGELNALALIKQAIYKVLAEYFTANGNGLRNDLEADLKLGLKPARFQQTLNEFIEEFPALAVLNNVLSPAAWLEQGEHLHEALDEVLINWLTNLNPAADQFDEFFNNTKLTETTAYDQITDGMQVFFKHQPGLGPRGQDLIAFLREPALKAPRSLLAQLEFIRENWGFVLGDLFIRQLLGGIDLLKEEQKASFLGPGPAIVPFYPGQAGASGPQESFDAFAGLEEVERFSPDSDWMPRVVMIAKNAYVWLNQLGRQYDRPIERLDQVPDETLDELASWGFTGLWLIGLWERSEASQRIKQLCGNPDAVASAYSLRSYHIAQRLGGEAAWQNLSERCGRRGIRLASDMVPNHMGIDSDWVYEHPDWFIGQDHSPFPVYSFNGPDLSDRPDVSINIEDHYYDRTDAAVVFKRYDHQSGTTRYVYHGNDGTSMPWNDTAQLDYLKPVVREAVIQTILDVARKFPIIRFDAAMTLTKKHYQRLWFPQPGSGGDIPSRGEHALTKAEFDELMPEEFWREVVERVAREVPDTLLLAEAFWLMEGYFVRTLGMHRVYNSAFMNMLRDEENAKYRLLIKNTLSYDPQILKRYVNFMNNPDEKTAVEQFGKGDKYFGICTVMATMPGLPMFGHGQIEGYTEKYGMEYYRPYWDETPDWGLIEHHRKVIFPLLHRRRIFADVENFRLYDLVTDSGAVDENVFAFSNYADGLPGLMIYHNRFGETSGRIKLSAPFLMKHGEESHLRTQELADALFLNGPHTAYVQYSDLITGLTYLTRLDELRREVLFVKVGAYEHHVYHGFKVVEGADYGALYQHLNGSGVTDLDYLRLNWRLAPLTNALEQLLDAPFLQGSAGSGLESGSGEEVRGLDQLITAFQDAALRTEGLALPYKIGAGNCLSSALQQVEQVAEDAELDFYPSTARLADNVREFTAADPRALDLLLIAARLVKAGELSPGTAHASAYSNLLGLSPLRDKLQEKLEDLGFSDYEASRGLLLINWLLSLAAKPEPAAAQARELFTAWLADANLEAFIEVNSYENKLWFNKERFTQAMNYYQAWQLARIACAGEGEKSLAVFSAASKLAQSMDAFEKALPLSEFQVEKLRALLPQAEV